MIDSITIAKIRIKFIGTVTQRICHKDYKMRTFPKFLQFKRDAQFEVKTEAKETVQYRAYSTP